jgi:hypothetical protein
MRMELPPDAVEHVAKQAGVAASELEFYDFTSRVAKRDVHPTRRLAPPGPGGRAAAPTRPAHVGEAVSVAPEPATVGRDRAPGVRIRTPGTAPDHPTGSGAGPASGVCSTPSPLPKRTPFASLPTAVSTTTSSSVGTRVTTRAVG